MNGVIDLTDDSHRRRRRHLRRLLPSQLESTSASISWTLQSVSLITKKKFILYHNIWTGMRSQNSGRRMLPFKRCVRIRMKRRHNLLFVANDLLYKEETTIIKGRKTRERESSLSSQLAKVPPRSDKKKRLKKAACGQNAVGDARKNNNGRKQAANKHPNKKRGQISKKTEHPGVKDTEAAAMRKREQKRRKNQRHRRNVAARKRAKGEAKREEPEKKITSEVESQAGSFDAKTSESDDNQARKPKAISRNDEKPSAVRSETQQPQGSTLSTGKLEESPEKSENSAKRSASKPPPVVSQLNVGDLTSRNHSPRHVQLETQERQDSVVSSHSCVSTAMKSDTIVGATRESVRDAPSSVSHDAAVEHPSDLCTQHENKHSGANVSTSVKSDTITSHVDGADSETETDVDSQSGKSSNPEKDETVSSSIDDIAGNKKPLLAEVDHKLRESSDLPKIPDESQTLPGQQEASRHEESQAEESAEKRIDESDRKQDQLEHDHVSVSANRLYWDKRCGNDDSSMKNSSSSIRKGEESPCKMNATIGPRQDSDYGTASTTTPSTNPEVIDVDGFESEKEQDETKVQPSKPASGLKSVPAKRQSQTTSSARPLTASMNDSPTLKDLIDANVGTRDKKRVKPKKLSGTKKKAAESQGERKSWQSTVIIVETSDEEESDSDATDVRDTTEQGTEVEFLKTAPPPKKRRQRGRPMNPATKFKKYTPKREPLEQHLRTNGQYNFNYTEEEAAREQERLFKQAAERVREKQASRVPAAASVPPGMNDLSHDHWRSPDLYCRLGLPPGAPIQLVKRQYRRLALTFGDCTSPPNWEPFA